MAGGEFQCNEDIGLMSTVLFIVDLFVDFIGKEIVDRRRFCLVFPVGEDIEDLFFLPVAEDGLDDSERLSLAQVMGQKRITPRNEGKDNWNYQKYFFVHRF